MYVTKSDYFSFSGIDLSLELKNSNYDNVGNAVNIFINRVEVWLLEHLESMYFVTPDSDNFDVEAFKKAVLHQIDYLRKNGDMSVKAVQNYPLLSHNGKAVLKSAGMLNVNHPRYVPRDPWL